MTVIVTVVILKQSYYSVVILSNKAKLVKENQA